MKRNVINAGILLPLAILTAFGWGVVAGAAYFGMFMIAFELLHRVKEYVDGRIRS